MSRLGGLAVLALVAWIASDAGGYAFLSADRALLGVAVAALVLAIVATATRPSRGGAVMLAALVCLTGWTALSTFWSDSPPRALDEAQRVAVYAAAAGVVIAFARWFPSSVVAAGVAGAAAIVAAWNLLERIRGVANPNDTGALAAPVGYANALALLCVVGLLVLPVLPRVAWILAPLLFADLVLQSSSGAYAALGIGVLAYVVRARLLPLVLALVVLTALSPLALHGNERVRYWRVAVREADANAVLGSGAGTYANWWLRERTVPQSTREAHSVYLETLAELGPFGLAFLLVALAAPLAARRAEVTAVTVAYGVAAAVDFHWELIGVTLPVLLLGAAGLARPGPPLRRAPVVALATAATAAAVLALAGNLQLERARDALAAGHRADAVDAAHAALRFAPYSSDAWALIGDATSNAAAYRRALDLDPADWSLWSRLARVESGKPRRLALAEAARLNPLGPTEP